MIVSGSKLPMHTIPMIEIVIGNILDGSFRYLLSDTRESTSTKSVFNR